MSCPQVIKVTTPGPPGPAGPTGPAGIGSAWRQAAGVPDGGVGAVGDFYLNTSNGDIYGPKTSSGWGSVIFNIAQGQTGPSGPAGATGATGPAGANGRTVLSGGGAPGSGTGANGDFYIDTTGWAIYGPKVNDAWPAGASLIGPAGATGATGAQGPAGPAGPAGTPASYSDATPQPLGNATAGTVAAAARADHVHALPTPSAIGAVATNDTRLSDAREWSADTITQAEAEAGTGTTRRAFTATRVFQAIAAWWAGSSAATKLAGIQAGATANATDAQLRDRSTHTGTQSASTITGLGTAAALDVAATGDATSGQVVRGNDSRLSDARTPTAHTQAASTISDSTAAGRALLTAADAAAQRTALDLGSLATQSGTFSGTSSGTNTGDQTITLTGDVTGTGTGSFAATLASTAVTAGSYGSGSQVSAFTVDAKGRLTAASSIAISIAATGISDSTSAGRALLTGADAAAQRSSLGLGSFATANAATPPAIGGTTPAAGSFSVLTASTELTVPGAAPPSSSAGDLYRNADTLRYRDSSNTERLLLNATDNLANLASAATARTNLGAAASGAIGSSGLTMATARLLGRSTAGTGAPEELTLPTGFDLSGGALRAPCEIGIACSDETSNLTTGTAKVTLRMPYAMTLTAVRLNVNTAPTGSALIVDVNEGGVSVFSTNPRIDAGSRTSVGSGTPAVISDTALADDAEITIDIDQIGSTVAGKGLKVWLIGRRA